MIAFSQNFQSVSVDCPSRETAKEQYCGSSQNNRILRKGSFKTIIWKQPDFQKKLSEIIQNMQWQEYARVSFSGLSIPKHFQPILFGSVLRSVSAQSLF